MTNKPKCKHCTFGCIYPTTDISSSCPCECHDVINKLEGWKEQLERDFGTGDGSVIGQFRHMEHFISNLLSLQRREFLKNLPPEIIIHRYMSTHGGKSTDYYDGWNDYRNQVCKYIAREIEAK